jgi:hypothetical protein
MRFSLITENGIFQKIYYDFTLKWHLWHVKHGIQEFKTILSLVKEENAR